MIASDLAAARAVQAEIEDALTAGGFPEQDVFAVKMAVEEALVNAIKHGNQMDAAKSVAVAYAVDAVGFEVRIADDGPGFDPEDVPDPTAPENLERPCGRGLLLIRFYMSEVEYLGRGNVVRMAKVRSASE